MPESEPNRSSRDSSININPLDSSTQVHPAKAVIRNCFVPTLLSLVIAIVSVATYRAEEASRQVVIAPLDHVNQPGAPGEVAAAGRAEAGNTRVEGAETGGAIVATDTGSAPSTDDSASDGAPLSVNRSLGKGYPHIALPPYARPVMYPPAYIDAFEQQRDAYYEAMQARQRHRDRIRAHRVSIQKRLQRDREAIFKRMREIEQRAVPSQDRRLNSMEPNQKLAGYFAG